MNAPEFAGNTVRVGATTIDAGARVLDARAAGTVVLVLVDPDSYLADPAYREQRRAGLAATRNLRAYSPDGALLWEAEMPEEADYYHRIAGTEPPEADSFSGFRCRLDPATGRIASRRFMK